jgi:hypothetical protein
MPQEVDAMKDRRRSPLMVFIISFVLLDAGIATAQDAAKPLPEGVFAADPALRVAAVAEVEVGRNVAATEKVAAMARGDQVAEVREAACRALGTLGTVAQLGLLDELARSDANDAVRAAAARAARKIRQEPEPATGPFLAPQNGTAPASPEEADDAHKAPKFKKPKDESIQTRHFAFGFGSMGGYGLAAIDFRGRIPLPVKYLPWLGIELGGGWTPPQVYVIVSGLTDTVTGDDIRWKLISGGAAVLFYLHRMHYIPLRFSFDLGQGPIGQIGYGFEMLNDEGFLSWGVEIGLLIHPAANKYAKEIVDIEDRNGDGDNPAIWPVAPFARFSLHFYPI